MPSALSEGLVDAARRAIARAVERVGHRFALAQGLAEALALARRQPVAWVDAELGDEALASAPAVGRPCAPPRSERRRIAVGRIEQLARLAATGSGRRRPASRAACSACRRGSPPPRPRRARRGSRRCALSGRPRRARQAAIDPGRPDREPEPAVVAAVTPLTACQQVASSGGPPAGRREGFFEAGAKVGSEGRMLGHGAIKAPWPNLLYPPPAGNCLPPLGPKPLVASIRAVARSSPMRATGARRVGPTGVANGQARRGS